MRTLFRFAGGRTDLGHATTGTMVTIGSSVPVADFLLTPLSFLV
jgi:hypothetical protein